MTKDQLQLVVSAGNAARAELNELEQEETRRENAKLVGNCYRYHNCYSCPETDADYWWSYTKVTGLDEDGDMLAFEFQTDVRGDVLIAPKKRFWKVLDGYEECKKEVFDAEWRALLEKLAVKP